MTGWMGLCSRGGATGYFGVCNGGCGIASKTMSIQLGAFHATDGQLIVNEFESLEAFISGPVLLEEEADRWLVEFWLSQLKSLI